MPREDKQCDTAPFSHSNGDNKKKKWIAFEQKTVGTTLQDIFDIAISFHFFLLCSCNRKNSSVSSHLESQIYYTASGKENKRNRILDTTIFSHQKKKMKFRISLLSTTL